MSKNCFGRIRYSFVGDRKGYVGARMYDWWTWYPRFSGEKYSAETTLLVVLLKRTEAMSITTQLGSPIHWLWSEGSQ